MDYVYDELLIYASKLSYKHGHILCTIASTPR